MAEGSTHTDDFYVRYYVGHKHEKFGHEFMEYELYPSGKLKYANNSNYKHDSLIRKEVVVSPAVVEEFKRIIQESNITGLDDTKWREPKENEGRQEFECKIGKHHISFMACQIGSVVDIEKSADPAGLKIFYYLTQDLKALVLSLIACHFKARPIP